MSSGPGSPETGARLIPFRQTRRPPKRIQSISNMISIGKNSHPCLVEIGFLDGACRAPKAAPNDYGALACPVRNGHRSSPAQDRNGSDKGY